MMIDTNLLFQDNPTTTTIRQTEPTSASTIIPSEDSNKINQAMHIASKADFSELTQGYYYYPTTQQPRQQNLQDIDLIVGNEKVEHVNKAEWVGMHQPYNCSYQRTNRQGEVQETITMGKQTSSTKVSQESSSYRPEVMGITMKQLRAVWENAKRRCVDENWEVEDVSKINMYDVYRNIVLPFTVHSKTAFLPNLPSTKGTQPPKFYVSFAWTISFLELISCLEQLLEDNAINSNQEEEERGGGITEHTCVMLLWTWRG